MGKSALTIMFIQSHFVDECVSPLSSSSHSPSSKLTRADLYPPAQIRPYHRQSSPYRTLHPRPLSIFCPLPPPPAPSTPASCRFRRF